VWQLAPGAKLVDVRTRAEWDWVGRIPGAIEIEWMSYPENKPNSHFLAQLKQQVDREALLMFICRSGARSHNAAALAGQAAGRLLQRARGLRGRQGRQRPARHDRWLASGRPAVAQLNFLAANPVWVLCDCPE
jgi:rhodanese-related sulfurtransferase